VGSGAASSLLPFLAGDALQNTQKKQQAIDFSFFFLSFSSLLLSFSPFSDLFHYRFVLWVS